MRTTIKTVRDFIILHYRINDRTDGDLWQEMREMAIPDTLAQRLALWDAHGRLIFKDGDIFAVPSWAAVLTGQGRDGPRGAIRSPNASERMRCAPH